MHHDLIELDDEGVAAVEYLKSFLKATNNPIHPASAPGPSNAPILDGEPATQAYIREMAAIVDRSIQERPLRTERDETREMRALEMFNTNADYKAIYAKYRAALNSDKAPLSKAEQERQAQAEKAIYEAGDEFARQRGISVEKARTILRRKYRDLAKIEARIG